MDHSLILKNIISPIIEKYNSELIVSITDQQWEIFVNYFIDFELDKNKTADFLEQLNLKNTVTILKELPDAYSLFIEQLAEEYVLGNRSLLTDKLIASQNNEFNEKVTYFKTLKNVITKSERKRIKEEIPILFKKLEFEIDETLAEKVALKMGREDLKKQFKKWDEELAEDVSIVKIKKPTKIFQLSYLKYAAAACVLIGFSFWFLNKPNANEPIFMFPLESVAEVSTIENSIQVIDNNNLGFGSKTAKITIIEKQQFKRIQSIKKILKEQKDIPETKVTFLHQELSKLKKQEQYYTFFDNELTIQTSQPNNQFQVVYVDTIFYFLKNKQAYQLKISKKEIPFQKVQDAQIINSIDDLLFKNGFPTMQDE